jgi:holliday junction DNA helicase RuvA
LDQGFQMMNHINGKVISIINSIVIVEVGGFGLTLSMPHPGSLAVGKTAQIAVYLHWNQENGPSLYGFCSELEKIVFNLIISCSGIGPKIGLAVLGSLSASQFLAAVREHDIKTLSSVNGIGSKKAEQMLVTLRHKVAKLYASGAIMAGEENGSAHWKDLSDALGSLNYSRAEIQQALAYLHESSVGKDMQFDQLLRTALSYLSQKR